MINKLFLLVFAPATVLALFALLRRRCSQSIALANSDESGAASTLSARAHRASAEAASSGDADAHFDAAVLHKQAEDAQRSSRNKATADNHKSMVDYHRGKCGASESALENSLSLQDNPFTRKTANSTLPSQDQFQRTPELPPTKSTLDRTIGADDSTIDQLAGRPDDLSPVEALNVINRLVQRKIAADGSSASDTAKHLRYWNEVTQGNLALYGRACSQFKPDQDASIPDADDTDEKVTSALYNSKFRELLPECGNNPVKVHEQIKLLFPQLIPKHRTA